MKNLFNTTLKMLPLFLALSITSATGCTDDDTEFENVNPNSVNLSVEGISLKADEMEIKINGISYHPSDDNAVEYDKSDVNVIGYQWLDESGEPEILIRLEIDIEEDYPNEEADDEVPVAWIIESLSVVNLKSESAYDFSTVWDRYEYEDDKLFNIGEPILLSQTETLYPRQEDAGVLSDFEFRATNLEINFDI